MPKADTVLTIPAPSPHRRTADRPQLSSLAGAALAGTTLAIAGPVGPTAEHPDAVLIAACDYFEQLEAEHRTSGGEDEDMTFPDGYDEAWAAVGEPATTLDGLRAKAQAIIAYYVPDCPPGQEVIFSLVEDAAQIGGAVGEEGDAELIAMLAKFDALELEIYPPGYEGPENGEEEITRDAFTKPIRAQQDEILDRACTTRARTLDGMRARVRTMIAMGSDFTDKLNDDDDPKGYENERMVLALLRDLVAVGGA